MPLRGHRNERDRSREQTTRVVDKEVIMLGDDNPGNFQYFLQGRAEAGGGNVKAVVNEHSLYSCPLTQNELLGMMAGQVSRKVASNITSFFSVIADETTDHSTTEQLCVAVRYPHIKDGVLKLEERFITFVEISSVTGKLMLCWHSLNDGHENILWLRIICALLGWRFCCDWLIRAEALAWVHNS